MTPWVLSVVLYIAAGSGPEAEARAVSKQIQTARMAYYEGRPADALPLWEKILTKKSLTDAQRHEVMRFKAFTLFVLNRREEAADAWRALLARVPDARVDPNEASPEFVQFFNALRPPEPKPEPEPAPSPEPSAEPAAGPAADPAPAAPAAQAPTEPSPTNEEPIDAAPAEGRAPNIAAPPPEVTSEERGCGIVLCLIPFGVGQFANASWIKGVIFAVLQAGGLATNIGMYWAQSERIPPGQDYLIGQHAALGVFGAALVAGILDAFLFP